MQHRWFATHPHQGPRARGALLAAFAAAGLAACADSPTVARDVALTQKTGSPLASVTCSVTVATRAMACGPRASLPSGVLGELYIGGQNVNVRLIGTNPSYNSGTGAYTGDVAVQNLTDVPLGTPDGSTVTGLRVFFHQMPVATSGSGTITITNADGVGNFTAANQPFYLYNQILAPNQTSTPKTWIFNVPNTVGTFQFQVYVATTTIDEPGPLHWNLVTSPTTLALNGVWAFSSGEAFAVGNTGTILRRPAGAGQAWAPMTSGTTTNLFSVSGTSPSDMYAVGAGGIFYFNGTSWAPAAVNPTPVSLFAVHAGGAGSVMAGGAGGNSYLGSATVFVAQPPDNQKPVGTNNSFNALWGPGPGEFFGAGANGAISHFIGGVWTPMASPTNSNINGKLWGSSTSNIYGVGAANTVIRYNGTTWSVVTGAPGSGNLFSVHGAAPAAVYMVGQTGRIIRHNGSAFFTIPSPTTVNLNAVHAANRTMVYVVGAGGTIIEGFR